MKTQNIHFEIHFQAKAEEVYRLLLDPERHALICEGEVKISNKPDGKFEVYDGYCHGYNIQLIENKKIVQAWHFDEPDWPEIHFSICTFQLEDQENGCLLTFEQSEVPESAVERLKQGWREYYWDRMQKILAA